MAKMQWWLTQGPKGGKVGDKNQQLAHAHVIAGFKTITADKEEINRPQPNDYFSTVKRTYIKTKCFVVKNDY